MNLKLYKQFSDAYQQCIRSAFEDSAIRGEVRTVARGLPTEGITILFEQEGRYCPRHSGKGGFFESGDV